MSERISFHDANGTEVSGRFDVSQGLITVALTRDERFASAISR
jgi:hypothetical protein